MSKIVQAINKIIANPEEISDVIQHNGEIYFLYKNKYVWSALSRSDDSLGVWLYPQAQSVESLTYHIDSGDWENVPMVFYNTKDIGTREATASFKELYATVKEKLFNVDKVLDDIIDDDDF